MFFMSAAMNYLFVSWIGVTAVLLALVIYGNTLSMHKEDQLYLNSAEQVMLATEQRVLIGRMHRLARIILGVAIVSAALLITSISAWVWIGLNS